MLAFFQSMQRKLQKNNKDVIKYDYMYSFKIDYSKPGCSCSSFDFKNSYFKGDRLKVKEVLTNLLTKFSSQLDSFESEYGCVNDANVTCKVTIKGRDLDLKFDSLDSLREYLADKKELVEEKKQELEKVKL